MGKTNNEREVRDALGQEWCPGASYGVHGEKIHCRCWYDGDRCCRCGAAAMTDEEKQDQGMDVSHGVD